MASSCEVERSIHLVSADLSRIRGILLPELWICAISSFASVVTIEKVLKTSPVLFSVQSSYKPAMDNTSFSVCYLYQGIFSFPICCHSKKPLTGIMHLFDRNDEENEGLVAILSDLALKVLYLIIFASLILFVNPGINPHIKS